jgi:hypothetical protein
MTKDNLKFLCDSFNQFKIEGEICDYCGIGFSQTSAIEPPLLETNLPSYHNAYILGTNGSVDCRISIYRTSKETEEIQVEVSCIKLKYTRR